MMTKRFTKDQRLTSRTLIKELFEKGSSFTLYPFKIFVMAHPDPNALFDQVLMGAPARNFKRAVDRNTIKRRMREAYRQLHEHRENPKRCIAYIYIAKELLPSAQIHERMSQTFQRFPI